MINIRGDRRASTMTADARRVRLFWGLVVWTGLFHLLWAAAVVLALFDPLGWGSVVAGGVAWFASVAMLPPFVMATFPDRMRSRWRSVLFDRPYASHWAAVHVVPLGWVLGLVVSGWSDHLWVWPIAAYGVALLFFGWGAFVTAGRLRVRTIDVPIVGLPADLDGYRMVHLSDLHVGSLTPPSRVQRWLDSIRDTRADLVVITGDLIMSGGEFNDSVARLLGQLEGADGVISVLGNHDYFGDGEALIAALESRGIRVLRNDRVVIQRGTASLIVAGVDDVWTGRADVAAALGQREASADETSTIVLLAHDPVLFEQAASMGVHTVLCGHTHGGQVALPWLARHANLTRLTSRYTLGVYRLGASTLVVNGGMGCTGVPIRIGVPPEVLVIRLQRV